MTHPPKTEQDFVSGEVRSRLERIAGSGLEPGCNRNMMLKPADARVILSALAAAPAQVSADVERVARAICVAGGDDPDREGPWKEWWSESAYAVFARAAIAALSHPASPVADPFAGVEVEPHLLEPVEFATRMREVEGE